MRTFKYLLGALCALCMTLFCLPSRASDSGAQASAVLNVQTSAVHQASTSAMPALADVDLSRYAVSAVPASIDAYAKPNDYGRSYGESPAGGLYPDAYASNLSSVSDTGRTFRALHRTGALAMLNTPSREVRTSTIAR